MGCRDRPADKLARIAAVFIVAIYIRIQKENNFVMGAESSP